MPGALRHGPGGPAQEPVTAIRLLSPEGALVEDDANQPWLEIVRALPEERLRDFHRAMAMTRRFDVEALPHRPRKQRGERLFKRRPVNFRNTRLAGQKGTQPLRDAFGKCSVR